MSTPLAPRFVDLHTHSTASDGALPPPAVVEAAARARLHAIALTDHDTVAGVAAAREAGARLGVRVIAGVELSAVDRGRELHILALHVTQLDALDARLAEFRSARHTRVAHMVDRLNALGVPVTLDAVLAEAGSGTIGRPHVARALVAGRWVRDMREAFDRYLGTGRPANVDKMRLTVADAIRLARASGGLAVLAHPGPEGQRERVRALAELGLDGLEVRHPSHTSEDTARLAGLAAEFGLVCSGGSDWHGVAEGPRMIGAMHVPEQWLAEQDERVAARSSAPRVA